MVNWEEILRSIDLTAYEFDHPYENKNIIRLSGTYAPEKMASVIKKTIYEEINRSRNICDCRSCESLRAYICQQLGINNKDI